MDKLFPIIRRKRRPLVEQNAETLKPEMLKPESPAVTPEKPKPDDGENVSSIESP
jgi:hypothetical protein